MSNDSQNYAYNDPNSGILTKIVTYVLFSGTLGSSLLNTVSGKFLRTLNFAVFTDFTPPSKPCPSKISAYGSYTVFNITLLRMLHAS